MRIRPRVLSSHKSKSLRPRMRSISGADLSNLPQLQELPQEIRHDIRIVSQVLPFKVNNYVTEELIDWSNVPDDPIYRLTFPHRDMIPAEGYDRIKKMLQNNTDSKEIKVVADEIRMQMNPHPAGQMDKNVPRLDGEELWGLQHKYRETVLFFPSQGQTCHSYCGYCFRWAQFVGMQDLKFANRDAELLARYLQSRPNVSDILFTGGDPMVMTTPLLEKYIKPLLDDECSHIRNIRFGTKSLSYWPYRFLTDRDADDLLWLLERCVRHNKHVAIMAHFSHPNEMATEAVDKAIQRIRSTGAEIRTQAPLVQHVNDDARVWQKMWRRQISMGCIPYYMFIERDTGAKTYFAVPLIKAFDIYSKAIKSVSGLARTARGPSMSALPGKVVVDGTAEIKGEKVFCLRFLQARNPDWAHRPFFAKYDEKATWLDDLKPAFGEEKFFFEGDNIQDWRQLDNEEIQRKLKEDMVLPQAGHG